jgi:hypothetical protein
MSVETRQRTESTSSASGKHMRDPTGLTRDTGSLQTRNRNLLEPHIDQDRAWPACAHSGWETILARLCLGAVTLRADRQLIPAQPDPGHVSGQQAAAHIRGQVAERSCKAEWQHLIGNHAAVDSTDGRGCRLSSGHVLHPCGHTADASTVRPGPAARPEYAVQGPVSRGR